MKKFMKSCGITALILIVIGLGLGMSGRAVAGQDTIREVVEEMTGGRIRMDRGSWWGWQIASFGRRSERTDLVDFVGVAEQECAVDNEYFYGYDFDDGYDSDDGYFVDWPFEGEDGVCFEGTYDINDAFDFEDDFKILNGNVSTYCPGTNIQNLDIEMGGVSFYTEESADDKIYLEASNVYKFQSYVEDGTLYIKAISNDGLRNTLCKVILYVPQDYALQEVEIEVGAGEMLLSWLNTQEVDIEVGAGSIFLENVKAREMDVEIGAGVVTGNELEVKDYLDVEVAMGEFIMEYASLGNIYVECAMGNVNIGVLGQERDYNYYLEGGMGNVDVGETCVSGLSQKKITDNGAQKDIDVECAMGNVTIWFID